VTAIQAIVSFSHAGRCRDEAVFAALADTSPVKPAAAGPSVTGSTAVRIALSTGPSTPSPLPGCAAALFPGLRRPPQSWRQLRPRDHALSEALHRPPLPPSDGRHGRRRPGPSSRSHLTLP